MNNLIFNDNKNSLYIFKNNSIKTLSSLGKIFSVSKSNISFGLLLPTYHTIKISNPISSTKILYLTKLTICSSNTTLFKTKISLISGGTLSSGDTLTPINNNFTSTNLSSANVIYDSSSGSGDSLIFQYIANVVSYTKNFDAIICIPPNSNMLLKIQNLLTITQSISILIFWYEI